MSKFKDTNDPTALKVMRKKYKKNNPEAELNKLIKNTNKHTKK